MATQRKIANATTRPSQAVYAALRRHEGTKYEYYNDPANNCTWGAGTFAHYGQCTPEELKRKVTAAQINTTLATRVNAAAAAVHRAVPNQQLTQAQFDALVSYTFNLGPTGARSALQAANQRNHAAVVSIMNQHVYAQSHGRPVILHGLVARRLEESAPFRPQQQK